MSPFFISLFKRKNRCPYCKASSKEGYVVCEKHLERAKQHWRKWSVVRKHEGKCCYCHRKSFKGFLRCKTHTIINKVKCKAWGKTHPTYGHDTWTRRKAIFESQGKCKVCKPHRKVQKGFNRCWSCRKRHTLFNRGIKVPPNISRKALTLILKQHNIPIYDRPQVKLPPGTYQCSRCHRKLSEDKFDSFNSSSRKKTVTSMCKNCRKNERISKETKHAQRPNITP